MPEQTKNTLRRGIVILLAALVAWAQAASVFAQSASASQQDIVRSAVEKLGVGKRVGIRLATGGVLYGRITGIGEQSFTLRPDHSKSGREIPYGQVTQLKRSSRTLLWAILGVSAAAIVIIVIALIRTPSTHTT
ncbi:MAG: hypothetical protein ACRD2P_07515 [Terriglobia bacterium]